MRKSVRRARGLRRGVRKGGHEQELSRRVTERG